MQTLKFSPANAKTKELANVSSLKKFLQNRRRIYSMDILSGHSCPFADKCLSKAVEQENGKRKIQDGKNTEFRCFSASQEVIYTNVYKSRKHNFDSLRKISSTMELFNTLNDSLPKNLGICRIHVAGDMFNRKYMLAWSMVAEANPDKLFYAYTKSLRYWLKYREHFDNIDNFVLTASYGGRDDDLIDRENLRFAKVVFSKEEAEKLGLEVDHSDDHAADPTKKNESFALMLHGVQPKNSEAADALKKLKKNKVKHSYKR